MLDANSYMIDGSGAEECYVASFQIQGTKMMMEYDIKVEGEDQLP
jgi:hypothetical protein